MLKEELICIKNIFIKQDEASNEDKSDDDDQDKKEEGDGESVHSDSSSQLHFSTPLCE